MTNYKEKLTNSWGKVSEEYATYRAGPPSSFYEALRSQHIGLVGQNILDLGTGTGILARNFALHGASVYGTDIAPEQIKQARALAIKEGLDIDFRVAPAESCPFNDQKFDVITANQCWLYFDKLKVIPEVKRLLKPKGVLVVSSYHWLPHEDEIAAESERLILQFNPEWHMQGFDGNIPLFPAWAGGHFELEALIQYREAIPFTKEAWRGRIRASRPIGVDLAASEIERFDQMHAQLLDRVASEHFLVLHKVWAYVLKPLC